MALANDPRTEVRSYPLIAFVHVPKTGGTSLKKFLTLCTPRGDGEIDRLANCRIDLLDVARNSDWIAGHSSRTALADALSWLNRPIEYFSIIRNPVDQLISHLNYSIHRITTESGQQQYDRTAEIVDKEVANTNFANVDAIIQLLSKYSDRYLNIQSKLLLGEDFAYISDEEIYSRLETYSYIANESTLFNLYNSFGFARVPEEVLHIRENVAVRYIDRQIFYGARMQEFILNYHQYDLRLYANLVKISWAAESRRSFRPSLLLESDIFTYENFDEQLYLHSNPDVANAVKHGELESAFTHFELYGCKEGRLRRRWFFAPEEPRARSKLPWLSGHRWLRFGHR